MTSKILCVSFGGKKVGAACYEEDAAAIGILHDTLEEDDFFVLKHRNVFAFDYAYIKYTLISLVLKELRPSHVIVNKSQDDAFLSTIRKECHFIVATSAANAAGGSQPHASSMRELVDPSEMGYRSSSRDADYYDSAEEPLEKYPRNTPTASTEKFISPHNASCSKSAPPHDDPSSPSSRSGEKKPEKEETAHIDGREEEDDEDWRPAVSFLPNLAFSFDDARKRLEKLFTDDVHDAKLLTEFRFDYSAVNMV